MSAYTDACLVEQRGVAVCSLFSGPALGGGPGAFAEKSA
jgi:hypothetical protein